MNPQTVASFFLVLAAGLGSAAGAKPPTIQCALGCTMNFNPMCSFNGLMYTQFPNQCELDIVSCQAVNSGKAPLQQAACPVNQQMCGGKYYCGNTQACVLDRIRSVNYCAVMCDSVANGCKSTDVCVQQEATTCRRAPCPTQDTCVPRLV